LRIISWCCEMTKITPWHVTRALNLHKEGLGYRRIASVIGLSKSTVSRIIHDNLRSQSHSGQIQIVKQGKRASDINGNPSPPYDPFIKITNPDKCMFCQKKPTHHWKKDYICGECMVRFIELVPGLKDKLKVCE